MERIIDRLSAYENFKGIKDNQITVACDLSSGLLSKARAGKADISFATADKILRVFTDLNPDWLKLGMGEMLVTANQTATHNSAPVYQNNGNGGNNVTQNATNDELYKGILSEMRALRIEKDRQIDRLLSIIENMQKQ